MTLETYIEHLTAQLEKKYGYAKRNRYQYRVTFFFGESEINPMKRTVNNETLSLCLSSGKTPETLNRVLK